MAETNPDAGLDLQAEISGAFDTALRVLSDPKAFYAALPREGGLARPATFAGIMLVVTAVIHAVLGLVGLLPFGFIAALFLTPIFGVIGLAIGAVILFLVSKVLGGEPTFESSLRIVCYASAIYPIQAVFNVVPYASLLASAYGMYVVIVGTIAVNRVPEQMGWIVLGGIAVVLILLSLTATIAARRVQPVVDDWSKRLEKSAAEMEKATDEAAPHLQKGAEELGKAAEQWAEEMQKAAERMKREREADAPE